MNLGMIPMDDLDRFQHKMRMREVSKRLPAQSWVRELRERDYVDTPPYSPIKASDMPLSKYLDKRAAAVAAAAQQP